MASVMIPAIMRVELNPNPALAGAAVKIYVTAADVEAVPYVQVVTAGEFTAGEM